MPTATRRNILKGSVRLVSMSCKEDAQRQIVDLIAAKPSRLLLSPHPDDIAYSLAGHLITNAIPVARSAALVVCTRTNYALGMPDSVERVTALRRAEDEAFCGHVGIQRMELTLEDACIRRGEDRASIFVDSSFEAQTLPVFPKLLEQFACLAEALPQLRVYSPLAIGGHVDHLLVRSAAETAFGDIYYYEDVPYAGRCEAVLLHGKGTLLPRSAVAQLLPDTGWLPLKLRLLQQLYPSQVTGGDLEAVRRACQYAGGERIWAVNERQPD